MDDVLEVSFMAVSSNTIQVIELVDSKTMDPVTKKWVVNKRSIINYNA